MSSQFDAGSAEDVDRRKVGVKVLAQSRLNGLKKLASDKDGRAWLWQFLEQASPFANPFDSTSDSKTAFNCGAKLMPVQITEQMLTHCPDEYRLMLKEAKAKPDVAPQDTTEKSDG